MQGRKLDVKTVNSMSVTSGMSRWDRETAAILAEDSAEEARTFKEEFYNLSGHEIYPGICVAIGKCEYGPAKPWHPISMRQEVDQARDVNEETVKPAMWGCGGSGIRIAAALSWMLKDYGELTMPSDPWEGEYCTYIAPMVPTSNSSFSSSAHVQDESYERVASRVRRQGVSLVRVHAEEGIDVALHSGEDSKSAHSDVRLVTPEELLREQLRAEREFFFECVTHREDVRARLEKAQYVLLPGSTLSIGSVEGDTSFGSPGGVNALCLMLEECTMDNRAVFFSLVGASFNRHMADDFRIILQYVDFLFLTELECRRLMVVLNKNPNMTLEESALWLATYSKHSGVRPRVVVVVPNHTLPSDFERDELQEAELVAAEERAEAMRQRLAQTGKLEQPVPRKAKFGPDGQEIFNQFHEYDMQHHFNTNELDGRIMFAAINEFWYVPGWPAAAAQKSSAHDDSFDTGLPACPSPTKRQMATYYYNAKLDFILSLDATEAGPFGAETSQLFSGRASATDDLNDWEQKRDESKHAAHDLTEMAALPIGPESHQCFADNFIGGFIAMVVRAELQINFRHGELDSMNTSTSFVQGTLPNERVLELARQRSLRLQRERERLWPGGHKPPPTPEKTATPHLGPRNRAAVDFGRTPDKQSLFQSPESRQRNKLTSAGQPAMQTTIESWGDHENDENQEYERSMIKWSGAKPMERQNIVSGRRLLHECAQAGLYCLYDGCYGDEDMTTKKCRFFQLF